METKNKELVSLVYHLHCTFMQLHASLVPMCRKEKNDHAYNAARALIRLCDFVGTTISDADDESENSVPIVINSHVLRRLADWLDNPEMRLPTSFEMIDVE